ncbi:MAG: hypothetical protein RL685_4754 [Pseudomonadota bacterium]|jgi:hypothetical protein
MMIPQLLTPELPRNTPRAYPRLRAPSLALCLMAVLGAPSCKGSIDNNEQRSSLQPNGRNGANGSAPANGAAPGAPAAFPATSPGDGEQNPDIRGLDGEADDTSSRGGGRRRAPARDRDEEEDEDVDAGVEEPLEDAGVLVDAGDGGVVEVDGGLAEDAGAVP